MRLSDLFQGEEHQPFRWNGGPPAALLVHGFPGTPAELRPLGASLQRAGWTVHGLLLPGFGAELDALFERRSFEWVAAVEQALVDLHRTHTPILLIGYSMGAALSVHVAKTHRPDGLILLAPFLQTITWWQQMLGLLLRPFIRQVRPFKKADFSDPQMRGGISSLFANVDLDDPQMQQMLRELTVPVSIFEQLYQVGHTAYRLAPEVAVPTLVIQGTQDEVVRLNKTRHLLQRLAGPLHYVEVVVEHDLVNPEKQTWSQVEQAVLTFSQTLYPR